MAKVLVLGNDTGPCLSVFRSLGRWGVEVHAANSDRNEASCRSRHLACFHDLPRYRDDGSHWVERVRELLARHSYDLLIPTSDSSLAQLLHHQSALGEIRAAVPNPDAAEVFTDKWATRTLAGRLGVPVARGRLLQEKASANPASDVGFPAVLKFRRSYECGNLAQKSAVRCVADEGELERERAADRFELIEEFIPGYCRGLSVLAREGRILVAHQHRRRRQEHPTGPSSSRISELCDPQLLEWTQRMVAATKLTGAAMFEYRHAPQTGATVLLEVNPRFWGSLPLALAAGADFPALLYGMLVEGRDPAPMLGSRPGVEKRNLAGERHAFAVALEQSRSPLDRLRLAARVTETAVLLISGARFDSWAADDPEPFRVERQQLLRDLRHYLGKGRRRGWQRASAASQ